MTTADNFTGHGGRLQAAERTWPEAQRPWVDLSTGINPQPYPAPSATRAARSRLPYPEEISALEAAAADVFGVAEPSRVLATPGAEAGIRLLPQILRAESIWIDEPAYAGHGDAWTYAAVPRAHTENDATVVVVVNPNNPDGRSHSADQLQARADRLGARGGWLVVDESFSEVSSAPSIAALGHPRIIALRSFGKFYGLAGLRLGFIAAVPSLIAKARQRQGEWPVCADAIAAGLAAYPDYLWAERTRIRLLRDAARLDRLLRRSGFEVLGGTSLFRLTSVAGAPQRFARLCARGLLCRPFADNPTWLRFGLPPASAWRRIETALALSGRD